MAPPTFTDVQIANMVLYGLGEDPLDTDLTDTTKRAKTINELYSLAVHHCMSQRNWRFATWKAQLNDTSSIVPADRWAIGLVLPADFMRLLFVYPPIRYEIQGTYLLCDETSGDVVIDYMRDRAEALWPLWFVDYVVKELIVRACKGITGDEPSRTQTQERDTALITATTTDAQQQPNQEPLPNPFVDCRH